MTNTSGGTFEDEAKTIQFAARRRRRGFTLMHLLGVIAMLAIPATILFPIIATPAPGEVKTDDADAVPAQDRASFINTIRGTRSMQAGLDSQLPVFRAWVKETQGADVSYGARDTGKTLVARYEGPYTRLVSEQRAKRLHWYYTYLRRAYLPNADCTVIIEDKLGRTLAACYGGRSDERHGRFFGLSWKRWATAGMPFTRSVHTAVASNFQRLVAATHRL